MDDITGKIFVVIIGIAFTNVVTYLITNSRNREKLTFDLHDEFNSESMQKVRNGAYKCIKKYPKTRFDKPESQILENLTNVKQKDEVKNDEELARSLFVLTCFYQRLGLAVDYNRVDKKLVSDLFGELFYWWYYVAFEDLLLPTDWVSSELIRKLKTSFDNNTNTCSEKKEKWRKRGQKYRDNIRSAQS